MTPPNTPQAADHSTPALRGFLHPSHLLWRGIPLLVAVLFGTYLASWIVGGDWHFVLAVFLGIPLLWLLVRNPLVALAIWFLVVPYVMGFEGSPRYIYWMAHRALIPGVLGLMVLPKLLRGRKSSVQFGPVGVSMLLFLSLAVVSIALLGRTPRESLVFLYDRVFVPFCAYWLIRQTAPTKKDLQRLLPVAFVTLIVQLCASLVIWFKPELVPPYLYQELHETERTAGTMRDTAIYTSTIIFLALLLWQYAVHCEKRWLRFVLFPTVLFAFFGVFLSFSRGSWIGGTVVLLGLLVLYRRVMFRAVLAGILALTLAIPFLHREIDQASERLVARQSAESRVPQVFAALRMIGKKPLFGWGYENYNVYVGRFTTNVGDIYYRKIHSSHNSTLTVLVEMGFIGFFFWALPTAWWLLASLKHWRCLPPSGFWSRKLLGVLWLAIAHMLIVSCFQDIVATSKPVALTVYWMALGFIASVLHSDVEPTSPLGRG